MWRSCTFTLLALCGAVVAQGGVGDWGYRNNEASRWSERFPECNATRQSPILLDSFEATWVWPWSDNDDAMRAQLVNYGQQADGVLFNDGHTVKLELNYTSRETTPRVVVATNGSTKTYPFASLHFHWPGEHMFPGQRFPLELHMVHTNEDGENLVLGYLFEECELSPPSGLSVIASAVRRTRNQGQKAQLSAFALQRLLPHPARRAGQPLRACNYFTYPGSLTTPPCTEGVRWLVHGDPQCVADWQMEAFLSVLAPDGQPMAGNSRPLQPRNGRPVMVLPCLLPWL